MYSELKSTKEEQKLVDSFYCIMKTDGSTIGGYMKEDEELKKKSVVRIVRSPEKTRLSQPTLMTTQIRPPISVTKSWITTGLTHLTSKIKSRRKPQI